MEHESFSDYTWAVFQQETLKSLKEAFCKNTQAPKTLERPHGICHHVRLTEGGVFSYSALDLGP